MMKNKQSFYTSFRRDNSFCFVIFEKSYPCGKYGYYEDSAQGD
jgi:hypothetical protein